MISKLDEGGATGCPVSNTRADKSKALDPGNTSLIGKGIKIIDRFL